MSLLKRFHNRIRLSGYRKPAPQTQPLPEDVLARLEEILNNPNLNENIHINALALSQGIDVKAVIGDRLTSDDFFALATLKQDFAEKFQVFKMKDNKSPDFHPCKIGNNLFYEKKNYQREDGKWDYETALIIEDASKDVIEVFNEDFENYVKASQPVSAEELFVRATQKRSLEPASHAQAQYEEGMEQ